MGELLESLHRLQQVETQLLAMRRIRETKVARVETCKKQVRKVEEKLQELQRVILEKQIKLDAIQLDLSSKEDSINKHRQGLNKAKTNKEYGAVLAAMNTETADCSKIELAVVAMIDEVAASKAQAAEVKKEKETLVGGVKAAEAFLAGYDRETGAERDRLQATRDQCAHGINVTVLDTFSRVAERHEGEAMAHVIKLRPKRDEHVCAGCNMTVTLQVFNELQTRDELQFCNACGRILFLERVPAQ